MKTSYCLERGYVRITVAGLPSYNSIMMTIAMHYSSYPSPCLLNSSTMSSLATLLYFSSNRPLSFSYHWLELHCYLNFLIMMHCAALSLAKLCSVEIKFISLSRPLSRKTSISSLLIGPKPIFLLALLKISLFCFIMYFNLKSSKNH